MIEGKTGIMSIIETIVQQILHDDLKKRIGARLPNNVPRVVDVCNMLEMVTNNSKFLDSTTFPISKIFAMVKLNLAQNFIVTCCSKFFSISS